MTTERITLDHLNAVDAETFASLLAGIVEHAPEIAQAAAAARPFASVEALHGGFFGVIARLPREAQVEIVCRHPELAGREAAVGEMTAESVSEQGSVGLDRLSSAEARRLRELNAAYRERFAFPFMICVRRHTRASIFREAERRLARDRLGELDEALRQIFFVTRLRIVDRVAGPGVPRTTGELAVEAVRDGSAAAGLPVTLREIASDAVVARGETDAGGRALLLSGEPLRIGDYAVAVGDEAPVPFMITEAEATLLWRVATVGQGA